MVVLLYNKYKSDQGYSKLGKFMHHTLPMPHRNSCPCFCLYHWIKYPKVLGLLSLIMSYLIFLCVLNCGQKNLVLNLNLQLGWEEMGYVLSVGEIVFG